MFALLAYTGTNAGAAVYQDLSAAIDPDFTQRNLHYTFTEPYDLLQAFLAGDDITNARILVPSWNAIGEFQLFPPNAVAADTILPNGSHIWFGDMRPEIPVNEEFQMQQSSSAALAQGTHFIWIGTKDWNRNLPRGRLAIPIRATGAVATTAFTWSATGALAFAQAMRGGVYAVVGAACQCVNALAFRLIFPRTKMYHGRKLRPGGICVNAWNDREPLLDVADRFRLGVWGYFHTFELPQLEIFGNVAGAAVQEVRLWLVYLGEDVSLLNQFTGVGY